MPSDRARTTLLAACRFLVAAFAACAAVVACAAQAQVVLPAGVPDPDSNLATSEGASDASPRPAATAALAPPPSADSPRASLRAFLAFAQRRQFEEASRFLLAPNVSQEERVELAGRLAAVLQHRVLIDLDAVSGLSEGDLDDGQPPDVEQVGVFRHGGREEPVRLVRAEREPGLARWMFSSGTVARVNTWYESVPNRWLLERLPPWLLREGPLHLAAWQWLALLPAIAACLLVGRLLGRVVQGALCRIVRRTRSPWDDELIGRVAGPLTLGSAVLVARLLLPWMGLPLAAEAFIVTVLKVLATTAIFWAAWRSVDVLMGGLMHLPWTSNNASAINLLKVGTNLMKGLVGVMGLLAILSGLGLPVATLVAGFGLGSLAIAFGAQKTVENLFGSISLAVDQPFRVGDFVKVEEFVGTVENIGLRSTRIRTLDRTTITLPNGLVANMRLETFATRDRMRLHTLMGILLETPRERVERLLAAWEAVLRAHPRIWPDAMVVRVKAVGASSLDIEIMAWFVTPVFAEFQGFRQEVLLDFLDAAQREGVGLAYPTQTLYLGRQPPLPGGEGPPQSPDPMQPGGP